MDVSKSIIQGLKEAIDYEKERNNTMWIVAVDTPYYPEVRSFNNYEDAKKDYDWEKEHLDMNSGYPDECVFIGEIKDWHKTKEYVVGED